MQFPHILIINLKERTDRWDHISKQLNDAGLPYERVEAIKRKDGWKGCSLSHKKAVQLAKERNYPWVLILEDDCFFVDGWKERFTELLPLLWERRAEWEVFSGGSFTVHKACKLQEKPPLFQFTGWSAHCILMHEGTYPRVLRYKLRVSIDDTYRRDYRMWCTYPHLATQTGGWSNIRKHMNKPSFFRRQFAKTETHLRKLKRTCGAHVNSRKAKMEELYREPRKTRKIQRH
jgi:GR25 family glycosyltransferase involved in LPS biosynthesis